MPERAMTSVGFGGGEVVLLPQPLCEVRAEMEHGLQHRLFLTYHTLDGEEIDINPIQVKILQPMP
jgi:hypothetical protein